MIINDPTDRPPTPQSYVDEQWKRILAYMPEEDRKLAQLAMTSAEQQAAKDARETALSNAGGGIVFGGILSLGAVALFLLWCNSCMNDMRTASEIRADIEAKTAAEQLDLRQRAEALCAAAQRSCGFTGDVHLP